MELKKIIEISRQKIIETHNAFYAGHPEVAKSYLVETYNLLYKYFRVLSEHDITKLVDTETPLEGLKDSVWTDWFERLKLTNPSAYRFFLETLTNFVQQYPDNASYVTVGDLQGVLTEI
ncbi:MAG TPA: hypothetical protein VMW72_10680 [Sedimentisphaerales bacterium]|nr:hypothetical protein [Sedimentisphaerales bacterium]